MSKFIKLLEMNEPTDGFKDPNDAVVNSIAKLCKTLKIPHKITSNGLLILNKNDSNKHEEEQEDPAKMTSALGALLSIPDQKEGGIGRFGKNETAVKVNAAKKKIADGISTWVDKWVATLR